MAVPFCQLFKSGFGYSGRLADFSWGDFGGKNYMLKEFGRKNNMKKILYWLPRILSILFICFLTLFSFDVFEGESPWYMMLAGFLVHSIPSLALIGVTVLAWRKPKIGGWLFILAGLALFVLTRFNLAAFVVYVLPLIIGILYLASAKNSYK